jgi:hypothetical protein
MIILGLFLYLLNIQANYLSPVSVFVNIDNKHNSFVRSILLSAIEYEFLAKHCNYGTMAA